MALVDGNMLKSVMEARIAERNKTDAERTSESAVHNSIAIEFSDAVTDRMHEYGGRLAKLIKENDDQNSNGDLIEYYQSWIKKWKTRI